MAVALGEPLAPLLVEEPEFCIDPLLDDESPEDESDGDVPLVFDDVPPVVVPDWAALVALGSLRLLEPEEVLLEVEPLELLEPELVLVLGLVPPLASAPLLVVPELAPPVIPLVPELVAPALDPELAAPPPVAAANAGDSAVASCATVRAKAAAKARTSDLR